MAALMSYAVSLQMQCYMFIVGHLDELPSDVIALLPIGIRRKLLLMLPALDICKLEETPVTDGISMDDEIWKLKCGHKFELEYISMNSNEILKLECDGHKFDMTLTWKDSYICKIAVKSFKLDELLIPNIHVPVECTGNFQGLNFDKSGRTVLPDRYKIYHNCSNELLIKLLVDSRISFKAIGLALTGLLRGFVGSEIPVECVPLLEKLLNSVIALEIMIVECDVAVAVVEKLLSIIFTNPCQVKYLTVYYWDDLELVSPFITNNPHCKLKNIKLGNIVGSLRRQSLDMLYCILDSQDELEKLHCKHLQLENKYSIFSRPTFKELTISGDIPMDSYVYIMQQFFLSPYPVTMKFYGDISGPHHPVTLQFYEATISGPRRLQIYSVQSHPTQHSKALELYYCCASEELRKCLPSTVHLKKLVLNGVNCVECFSMLDNITVDECISVFADDMDYLNDLFHITTAKEWNIDVTLSEGTQDKFIVALTNIKGVVTKLRIDTYSLRSPMLSMPSIAEAIFTNLQSSLSQLKLYLPVHGYQSSDVRELYKIWKQCGSIQLKKLTLRGFVDDDDDTRHIVALISNDFMY